jgi:hypothetical protein
MAAAQHFQSAVFPLSIDGFAVPGYAAVYALALNFLVSALLTPVFGRFTAGSDETSDGDYRLGAAE